MSHLKTASAAVLALVLAAAPSHEAQSSSQETEGVPRSENGTSEMVQMLSDLAQRTNPEANPYANRARAAHFKGLAQNAEPPDALRYEFEAAKELLEENEES